ncbi:uncharacterized protein HD556DRAFT_163181 [Suillus plorans]|uniref:DUF6533 domain-containing protein n=1 Tax=Suillus plorans TaxID=116603 RepID=A0A9P7DN28_9AGAM|nr:uncharacterized protein HD556DRAFT_163181 [Suillus plorans]KAG1798947.1 hypothetical protein HD556DRAFT_163181 [Suillus plorans]
MATDRGCTIGNRAFCACYRLLVSHHERCCYRPLTFPTRLHLSSTMTYVSNDPSWWPRMNLVMFFSYWEVATGVVMIYDWVLTFGEEIELIWRQRWSLMTVLYLIIRYIRTPYSVVNLLRSMPSVSLTDAVSAITYYATNGTTVAVICMLGVITIARLHAMYQGSRMMLIFLVIIFLAVIIACGVITAIELDDIVAEESILSGTYMCGYVFGGDEQLLTSMFWMLNTVWEILALCLSVWVAVKHFRELRRLGRSTGSTIGDYFRVLIQSHVLYFASFVGVSCLQLAVLSLEISHSNSIAPLILGGALRISSAVQMFVLGPRLILSVREYHAKLVEDSDADTSINSIVFQERVHVSTSSTV